jgi:hypothetical protein
MRRSFEEPKSLRASAPIMQKVLQILSDAVAAF